MITRFLKRTLPGMALGLFAAVLLSAGLLSAGAASDAILRAYGDKIDELKAQGGYVTADVISVTSQTPNLDAMLVHSSKLDYGQIWGGSFLHAEASDP